MESGGRFLVREFRRNLAPVTVKMSSLKTKFYECYSFIVIDTDNAAIYCKYRKGSFTITGYYGKRNSRRPVKTVGVHRLASWLPNCNI
jgi:hypothetical protein